MFFDTVDSLIPVRRHGINCIGIARLNYVAVYAILIYCDWWSSVVRLLNRSGHALMWYSKRIIPISSLMGVFLNIVHAVTNRTPSWIFISVLLTANNLWLVSIIKWMISILKLSTIPFQKAIVIPCWVIQPFIHNSFISLDLVISSMISCFGQNLAIPSWSNVAIYIASSLNISKDSVWTTN